MEGGGREWTCDFHWSFIALDSIDCSEDIDGVIYEDH
jgi:hypothetical protein